MKISVKGEHEKQGQAGEGGARAGGERSSEI